MPTLSGDLQDVARDPFGYLVGIKSTRPATVTR
jgi:hypothetical protein